MLAKKALSAAPSAVAQYVEDVFSTYLYTGTGSAQTITNNIDLSGEGGLVWIKSRSNNLLNNVLMDTARGVNQTLRSDSTSDQSNESSVTAFNSTGFTLGTFSRVSNNGDTFSSWTFRKAEKFFDVVTYTGNSSTQTISHNLGSVPGMIIVKSSTLSGSNWAVYHRSANGGVNPHNYLLLLNDTMALAGPSSAFWGGTAVTSTTFSVGNYQNTNQSGETYVAYLFAHDAGGFGEAGDQNVITCGTFTTNGSEASTTTLGWEPQWLLLKRTDSTSNWFLADNMRGLNVEGQDDYFLNPNLTAAESNNNRIGLTSTGFTTSGFGVSATFVYIAIRRGPMKTPTTGTEVFDVEINSTSSPRTWTPGFPVDLSILAYRNTVAAVGLTGTRLTGNSQYLYTSATAAEDNAGSTAYQFDSTTGNLTEAILSNAASKVNWMFRRAPGFFDVVCYKGNGTSQNITHNLGVTPELMLVKNRSSVYSWRVYSAETGGGKYLILDLDNSATTSTGAWNNTAPTSSVFSVGASDASNRSGDNHVAYLFASLTGISKVGSYTGNGSSVTVTTGFQPRFILVKRTDSTGNWIVSDSARGLIAGNDPYLLLNSSAAEDTDEDWVDISSTGFTVNETSASNANTNTGTYIYLAIA